MPDLQGCLGEKLLPLRAPVAPFGKLPTAAVLAAGRIRSVPLMPGVPTPADAEGLGARVADGTFADGRPAPCLIAAAAPAGDTTATAFAAGTCGLPTGRGFAATAAGAATGNLTGLIGVAPFALLPFGANAVSTSTLPPFALPLSGFAASPVDAVPAPPLGDAEPPPAEVPPPP
ncbi:hypothetical protein QU42_15640 [Bradyrhizobium sp. UASWS1016]|nr:hypothetical protein QU41_35250 [Bradyrhizobium elkanii]OCX29819.1 hypothetical protein QU42_15640 [Bradyrhizobium sp. UASWS1016]